MMDWSSEIKEIRETLLLSQGELGVSFAMVNRWENGHHELMIKAKKLFDIIEKRRRLSERINIQIAYF
jgi:Predicted transcriptional regulator